MESLRDIFGKPYEGIHKERLFGLAQNDVLMTILFIIFIVKYYSLDPILTTICVIVGFILIHRIFDVKTALNQKLFLD